jgi:hypothetical protein
MHKAKDSAKPRKMSPVRHSEAVSSQAIDAQVATLMCTLAHLRVSITDDNSETILSGDAPVTLSVTVDFGNSGAIALMPLGLQIRADFFAKPIGRGEDLELGNAILQTVANQFTYSPALRIETGLEMAGMVPEKVYRLTALLRVGAPDYPALITGVLEDLIIQIY